MAEAAGEGARRATGTRIGAAAVLLASSVLASRLLGFAREMLLAYRLGAGAETDAYYAAFQIPDLLNYLLAGGALSIAFLPIYTRHLARGADDAAEHLLATVLGTLGAIALASTVLLWWFAEPLVALQFPRFDSATRELTIHLTRIVLPAQVFFVTGGIINATLLARNRFGAAAAAPLLYNAGIIAGGLFLAPQMESGAEGFAWGALGGALLGPFLAPLLDTRGRVRIRVRFSLRDRAFLGYMIVAAPLMLGQSLLTVDEWYERWFGALLHEGAVAHLGYARRLMLVPVAVVGQAIAAAALPTLSRLWAEGRREDLDRVVLRTLQAGLGIAVLAAATFTLFAREVVVLIYQRGAFTPADTTAVSTVLSLLALAVPAWIVQQIAARAFYARGDTWRPMLLGTVVALAAIPLYLQLGYRWGVSGLAAAGAIGMSGNAVATVLLARWLHGAPKLSDLLGTAARMALIAAVAGAIAQRLLPYPEPSLAREALLNLACAGPVFAVLGGAGAFFFGDAPTREAMLRLVGRRRARASKPIPGR